MADIAFSEVLKIYPGGNTAVDRLSLSVADGEFMVLVGPSGCGKTTALRMVAGLEEITDGTISIGGEIVNNTLPKDRDIAMVFQNYALYPQMSVAQNMGFALKIRNVPKAQIAERVQQAAQILKLTEYLDRRPKALSGGQRQRVAMGRAIVREPRAFLMDEPLSNLDAQLRVEMRSEISRIQRLLSVATIYVTHDQTEAMTMGDRVAVMRGGVLQQVATPEELYERPANAFVAGFIGSPPMNVIAGLLQHEDQGEVVMIAGQRVEIPSSYRETHQLHDRPEGPIYLGVRPEDIRLESAADDLALVVTVTLREALGSEVLAHFSLHDGDNIVEEFSGDTSSRLIARLSARSIVRSRDRVTIYLKSAALHFFEPLSGSTLRR